MRKDTLLQAMRRNIRLIITWIVICLGGVIKICFFQSISTGGSIEGTNLELSAGVLLNIFDIVKVGYYSLRELRYLLIVFAISVLVVTICKIKSGIKLMDYLVVALCLMIGIVQVMIHGKGIGGRYKIPMMIVISVWMCIIYPQIVQANALRKTLMAVAIAVALVPHAVDAYRGTCNYYSEYWVPQDEVVCKVEELSDYDTIIWVDCYNGEPENPDYN